MNGAQVLAEKAREISSPVGAPVLSVRGLTTSFLVDGQWASVVRNVSFDVMPGETVAIVGESGSGKSVTVAVGHAASGKECQPHRGTHPAQRQGHPFAVRQGDAAGARQRRRDDLSGADDQPQSDLHDRPADLRGPDLPSQARQAEARAETIRLLEKVRIPNASSRFDDYPHQFSGGMRQRVMIAMALASRPKLLIADEPTTALDVTIQGQILDLIKQLQEEEGMSVLFITHDMGVVAEIADRTVVMYRGEVVEIGHDRRHFCARQAALHARASRGRAAPRRRCTATASRLRFPVVDEVTGERKEAVEEDDTVKRDAAPVLEVKNLVTRFDVRGGLFGRKVGAIHAVENVSFDLFQGETLALVGESGCGKSTTGRSIMRLVEPNGGDVRLDGFDVLSLGQRPTAHDAPQHSDGLPGPVREPQSAHDGRHGGGRTDHRAWPRRARSGARAGSRAVCSRLDSAPT